MSVEKLNVYDYTIKRKYSHDQNESWEQICQRVAVTLAHPELSAQEYWTDKFYNILKHKLFLCGGRILANAGRIKQNMFNCFVRDVQDSIKGPGGWADTLAVITEVMAMGGGVGLAFDKVRPKDALIKGVGGISNGSVAFMRTIDGLKYSMTGGTSRGIALLFGQALNHPDIIDFIKSKEQDGIITAANISLLVDNVKEFLDYLDDPNYEIDLIHSGKAYNKERLSKIVDLTIDNMLKNGEPGFINRDLMNKDSSISYIGPICCTNPCGELPHIADGCCDLGSIDLAKFVSPGGRVNWNLLKDVVQTAVRMLDNAYDVTIWPTEKIKYTNQRLRKLGLGIMGAHHFLIRRGIRYSDMRKAGEALAEVMKFITINAYWESVELAKEKGQFEALDREKFLEKGFTRKLPRKLRENIFKYGIRNCSLTSIAPTGTIAIAAHTSPGLEPCIAKAMKRNYNYRWEGDKQIYDSCNVIDPVWLEIYNTEKATLFEEAADISLENHLYIQAAVQLWVDSSVSKTVNFHPGDVTRDQVKKLMKKYFHRLKGFTMLPEGSRKDAPQQPVPEKVWRKWIETGDYTTYGQTQKCPGNKCDV
jgi:ribonucleoside-diphosphate reductase alpha chain